MMQRVVVTGATGFLGGAVVRQLHAAGFDVLAVGRNTFKLSTLKRSCAATYRIDLAQPIADSVVDQMKEADGFVHCAALSSAWGRSVDFDAANVEGTQNALHLAKSLGVKRFINISSPTIYFAMRDQLGVTESQALPKPINDYARTKAAAEKLVQRASDLNPITLRPRGIYGAGETTLLPRLLDAAQRGPLPLMREGVADIDLTHVSDVVSAIFATLHAEQTGTHHCINISSGDPTRIFDIVNWVCAQADVPVNWRKTPWRAAITAAQFSESTYRFLRSQTEPKLTKYKVGLFAFRQSLDISKAQQLLGWSPKVSMDEGLALTFNGVEQA